MNNFNNQSKGHKVVATQEMITAQNSENQSKLFGTFTEEEVRNIVENSGESSITPFFAVKVLKQAERLLDKARMSDEARDFIKGAFQMMAGFGNWNTKERYEYIVQNETPDDIRYELEESGDREAAAESLEWEIGNIINGLNSEQYWFPEEEVEAAKEALNEYLDVVREYGLEEEEPLCQWLYDEVDKVLAAH